MWGQMALTPLAACCGSTEHLLSCSIQEPKVWLSGRPCAMGSTGLVLQWGCVRLGRDQPLPLLQPLLCWQQQLGKALGQGQSPMMGVLAVPSLPREPPVGSRQQPELVQGLPWQQSCSPEPQASPWLSACHPGAVIPRGGSGAGACLPLQVHKPQPT